MYDGWVKFTINADDVRKLYRQKSASGLPDVAKAAIPLAVGGALLARKPGIQAAAHSLIENPGSTQETDLSSELPAEVKDQASLIHQTLLAHGLDPSKVRMGVDAPPGSGKTTLSRAISQQTGMSHYGLDWEPGNWWKSTIGAGKNVEAMPRLPKPGEIIEHYMLNRTYDPEKFDAMIHIRRDPDVIKKQLIKRGRGAYVSDVMDLKKSLGVADLAFRTLDGDEINFGNGVFMKVRPRQGWGNTLERALEMSGIDHQGLTRHEKLLSLHEGKKTHGAGWTPYVKNPLSDTESALLGASIPLGIIAAKALRK